MVLFCQAYVKLEWKSLFRSAKIRVMVEYFTEALVLDKEDSGDLDARIILYTEDLGKITAKAKSVKRITSKLNGHLEPLNFIQVRLVEKNGFQIVDALTIANSANFKENPAVFFRLLNFIKFFKEMYSKHKSLIVVENEEDYPKAIKTAMNPKNYKKMKEEFENFLLFDTTLRDGEQTPGVSLTPENKLQIAKQLDRLGVDIIEAGLPITSKGEIEAIKLITKEKLNPV